MTLYKTSHGKILADYRLPRQKKLYTNTSLWCCRYRSSGFCCSCWHYLWCRRRYSRRSSSRWRTWIKSKIKISTLFITQVFLLNQKCENYNLHSVNYFCTPEIWNYRGKKQVGYKTQVIWRSERQQRRQQFSERVPQQWHHHWLYGTRRQRRNYCSY